jgi:hypothetical protein
MKLDQAEFKVKMIRSPLKLKSDNWQETAFHWVCTINGISFDYYTGAGMRYKDGFKEGRPIAPKIKDVVYSLLADSSAIYQSFHDWCNDFGYDEDSRKALNIYLACQANAVKLQRTGLCSAHAQAELEDY